MENTKITKIFSLVLVLVSVPRAAMTVTMACGVVPYARMHSRIVTNALLIIRTCICAKDVIVNTVDPAVPKLHAMFAVRVGARSAGLMPISSPAASAARRTVSPVEPITIVKYAMNSFAMIVARVSGANSVNSATAVKVTT